MFRSFKRRRINDDYFIFLQKRLPPRYLVGDRQKKFNGPVRGVQTVIFVVVVVVILNGNALAYIHVFGLDCFRNGGGRVSREGIMIILRGGTVGSRDAEGKE